ncbi:MAG: methyl-accepting chemotaxis protein [Oscillospiraceae bacterium]
MAKLKLPKINKKSNIKAKPRFNISCFRLKRNSIKTKLIIFVCLMSIVVIMLLALVNYFSLSGGVKSTVNQMITPITTEAASDVSVKISQLKIKSDTALQKTLCSNNIGTTKGSLSYLKYMFNEYKLDVKDFAMFKLGDYFIGSDRFNAENAEALKELEVYQKAKSKGVAVTEPIPYEDGSGSEFIIAVSGTSNVTSYVLVMYYDAQILSDIVDSVQFSENSTAYIINSEGTIIASNDISNVTNKVNYNTLAETDSSYKPIADLQTLVMSGESGSESIVFEGVTSRVAYSPIEDSDWSLILIGPESDFNGILKTTTTVIIVFSVILIIAAFICTFIIMNGVVNPIIGVTSRLKALSDGDLSSDTPVIKQKNEVGVLSESLAATVTSLRAYIEQISEALGMIAEGNLAFEMDGEFRGDFVKIKESFNAILSQLRNTFGKISESANTVTLGASQVASGSQLLSSGAAQQSEAVNEVSNRMEDIVEHISDSVKFASETEVLAANIKDQIHSCNHEMTKMLGSMDDISKSSAQISDIIRVIDDIAFQTNILALNAAVEAARAGDAGLGFAVVADEVRNLANMSADAAKQTSELIEDSLRNVKRGTAIAKTTAESLDKIVLGASEINDKVKSIAESAEQQNKLISDIYNSVNSVTVVIDSTTATAEQSSAAASDMSEQAEVLRDMIDFFKIDFNDSSVEEDISGNEQEATPELDLPVFDSDETAEVDSELDFDSIGSLGEPSKEPSEPETTDASDISDIPDISDISDISDTSDNSDITDNSDNSETDEEVFFEPENAEENNQ